MGAEDDVVLSYGGCWLCVRGLSMGEGWGGVVSCPARLGQGLMGSGVWLQSRRGGVDWALWGKVGQVEQCCVSEGMLGVPWLPCVMVPGTLLAAPSPTWTLSLVICEPNIKATGQLGLKLWCCGPLGLWEEPVCLLTKPQRGCELNIVPVTFLWSLLRQGAVSAMEEVPVRERCPVRGVLCEKGMCERGVLRERGAL